MTEHTLPRTTPLLTEVIMNPALAPALFQTYARLYASAWRHEHKYTEWLTLENIQKLLGRLTSDGDTRIDRATIFRRLGALRELLLIRWETNKNRIRIYFLEVRPEVVAKSHFCDPSSSGSDIYTIDSVNDLLLLEQSQKCDKTVIDPDAYNALGEIGFGEPTRTTLADMPHVTAKYVKAMAAQFWFEGFKRSDLGALKYRIENKWPAPDLCEKCGGLDGRHTDTCSTIAEARTSQADARRERIEAEKQAARQKPVYSENERIWNEALDLLKLQVTGATFDTWLRQTRLTGTSENGSKKFTIECHSENARDWLSNRLRTMIAQELATVTGCNANGLELEFVVQERAQ